MSIPRLCECGCGEPLPLAKDERPSRPRRFILGHNLRARELQTIHDILLRLVIYEPGCLATGCWEYPSRNKKGYGQTSFEGRKREVHLLVYEHFIGKPPAGTVLHHRCRNKPCANFEHVVPLTQAEPMRCDGHSQKTHCKRGHEFTAENTYFSKSHRWCRECRRFHDRKRSRRAR